MKYFINSIYFTLSLLLLPNLAFGETWIWERDYDKNVAISRANVVGLLEADKVSSCTHTWASSQTCRLDGNVWECGYAFHNTRGGRDKHCKGITSLQNAYDQALNSLVSACEGREQACAAIGF